MLPKNIYMKLSKKDKQKVKKASGSGAYKVKGSGDYIFDKKNPWGHYGEKIAKYTGLVPRSIGAYGGHLIGKMFGSGAYYNSQGKFIPSYKGAHKVIKGSGAYYDAPKEVATNATSPPSFGSNRTIVRHREFIGNILGSTGFTINTWNVNPGEKSTFPWLSNLAINYEKYRPIGIIFEFKSTSASALNSTNTALGTVMMAPRYNAIATSIPTSKMEMLQIENCVSICPAESGMCGIECAKNYNPLGILFVRNTWASPATGSEQFYDFCDFYLATEGMQATAVIGELWVTYELELLTPILNGGQVGNNINYYKAISTLFTNTYGLTSFIPTTSSNMFLEPQSATNRVYFPQSMTEGQYIFQWRIIGGSTSLIQPNLTGVGCNVTKFWCSSTGQQDQVYVPEQTLYTGTILCITINVVLTGYTLGGAYIQFTGGTLPLSPTAAEITCWQIPDDAN